MSAELWEAIACNDLPRVQRVLCTREDIDLNELYSPTTDDYCENVATTYLLWACKTSSPEVVSALVTAGADVNASAYLVDQETHDNWRVEHEVGHVTPLIYAVKRRKIELVRKLLQTCDADPNATNGEGRTALHYVVEPILPAEDWHSLRPLVAPDLTGAREDIAMLLLQAGVKLYLADQKGNTPLHIAAANTDVPICKILLSPIGQVSLRTGMQVSPMQNDGGTPMHSAIESGGRDEEIACIVEMLAQKGADLKARKFGLTPLHLAAQNGLLATVKALVEAGADVEAKAARTGLTPLDMARHTRKRNVVVYLEGGDEAQEDDEPNDIEDKECKSDTFDNNSTTESALQTTSQEAVEVKESSTPSQISVWTVARPELGESREEFEGRVSFGKQAANPLPDSMNVSVGSRKSSVDSSVTSFAGETASSVSTLPLASVQELDDSEKRKQSEENKAIPSEPDEGLPSKVAAFQNGRMRHMSKESAASSVSQVASSASHATSSASNATDRSHRKHRKPAKLKDKDILSSDEKMDIILQTLGDMHHQMAKMTNRIAKLETEKKSGKDGGKNSGQ